MFHKAASLKYLDGTELEVHFQDGNVKVFDVASLFTKYPQMEDLKNRNLFLSGKLMGTYGIRWNDELDLEVETVYENGTTLRVEKLPTDNTAARAIAYARSIAGMSQKELSRVANIDQSDISKIERGIANPSVSTLERLAKALGGELEISIKFCNKE